MQGRWIKKGLIYVPAGQESWSRTHAQVPVADVDAGAGIIRIYYSTRDDAGRSLPGCVVVDADNPAKTLDRNHAPLLPLGPAGAFDDCGVMPSWIINNGHEKRMYYIGWNVRNTIPYHNAVGLATSKDGGRTWEKFSAGPVMERNHIEPYYCGTSCVLCENNIWKNWYLSCTEWRAVDGRMEPRYHIKYAESEDGIRWKQIGKVAIDYLNEDEAGIVKASVMRDADRYRMWFSFRRFKGYRTDSKYSYRIGYAESQDGIVWNRFAGREELTLGKEGEFDSAMTAYPHVVDVKGRRLMFYNGNGFGKTGFGWAELEK